MSDEINNTDNTPWINIEDLENNKVYTTQEIKEQFLKQVVVIAENWMSYGKSKEETVQGTIFSILAMIDGCSIGIPGFMLAPITCRENQMYARENDEKYYLLNDQEAVFNDIGGSLHDEFSRFCRNNK